MVGISLHAANIVLQLQMLGGAYFDGRDFRKGEQDEKQSSQRQLLKV